MRSAQTSGIAEARIHGEVRLTATLRAARVPGGVVVIGLG